MQWVSPKGVNDCTTRRSGVILSFSKTLLSTLDRTTIVSVSADLPHPPMQTIAFLKNFDSGGKLTKISMFLIFFANKIQCINIILCFTQQRCVEY